MKVKKDVWGNISGIHTEIIKALSDGRTAKEIAEQRKRSIKTIEAQIAFMLAVYGANNRTHLVAIFLRKKIIE